MRSRPLGRHQPRRLPVGHLIVAGLVTLGLLAVPGSPARADDQFAAEMTVTALTGVLGPGSVPIVDLGELSDANDIAPSELEIRALIHNLGNEALDQLRIVVEIHPAALTRNALHRALDNAPTTAALRIHDEPVRGGGTVAAGDVAGVRVRLPVDTIPWAPDGGVHPVTITLMRGTEVLAETTTAAVWLSEPPLAPLHTTVIWPLDAAPTRQLGGVYDSSADLDLRTGERLDRLLTALERHPQPAVTTAPAVHLIDELRDRANGFVRIEHVDQSTQRMVSVEPEDGPARLANAVLQRIRSATRALESAPVSGVYARADLDELTAVGASQQLRRMAETAASDGARRLAEALEIDPDPLTSLLADPVTPSGLDLLPTEQVLLPHDAVLRAGGERFDLARPVGTASGRTLWAVAADPYLSTTGVDEGGLSTPLAVQRFVASSAMLFLDDAERTDRVLLVMPPPDWAPSTATAAGLLEALDAATWLVGSDPSSLVAEGRRSARALQLALSRPEPALPREVVSDLADARERLDVARAITPDGVTTVGEYTIDELEDALLTATSHWLRGRRLADARNLTTAVRQAADGAIGAFEINASRVTLTSDTGMIPVALHRTSGGSATVVVEVVSPGRLAWPEGRRSAPLELAFDDHRSVSFATKALSTGTFPVTVRLLDPSGRHELQRTTLPVRSTAISRPALIVTGGLVATLIGFGAWRQGGGGRRIVRTPAGDDDDRR